MGTTEMILFIVLVSAIVIILITGIVVFVFRYRKRKIIYTREKEETEKQHKLALLNNQLQIQQQTMQFIGSEIHDSVTQKLTLASIYSQRLEFENQYPPITEKLNSISNIINDSLSELRDLSKTLTDNRVQDTTLPGLLQTECDRVNDTNICKAVLHSDFDREMSVTVKSFLFRVMQEFIQNSLKHAACNLIEICLKDSKTGLEIIASDNGKGFDTENTHSNGIGLTNMKRRVALIGGRFSLQSEPGKGICLQLFIDNKNLLAE
jgi:signal transduction histidine kinase